MQKFPRTRIKTVAQVPRADWSFSKHPLSSQHKQATRGCSLAVCAGPHRLNTYKIAGLSEYLQEYVKNVRFAPPAARSGVASATCVPPSEESLTLGPRVAHISAPQDSTLLETVAQELQLEQWFVHELIAFGAVHWCPVPPKRHSTAAQDGDGQVWKRDAALERFGRQPVNAQPQRASEDVPVNQHAYIRVHVHPKRFPAVYTTDWKSCVIHDGLDFVIVDKPAGVQITSTVDNILENVLVCTAHALQLTEPLLVTHRLDMCTQGLVVLGKTTAFVQHFNKLLQQQGAVRKFYKTLTQSVPPLGRMQHYIKTGEHAKGQPARSTIAHGPGPGLQHCSLTILEVLLVTLPAAAAASADWQPDACESLLELETGRTHQIRLQLAAEGFALYGDTMYSRSTTFPIEQAPKEPIAAIGLQACKMLIQQPDQTVQCFQAKPPWWQQA